MIINKVIDEKGVQQIARQSYAEFSRVLIFPQPLPAFDEIPDNLRMAFVSAIDRAIELTAHTIQKRHECLH